MVLWIIWYVDKNIAIWINQLLLRVVINALIMISDSLVNRNTLSLISGLTAIITYLILLLWLMITFYLHNLTGIIISIFNFLISGLSILFTVEWIAWWDGLFSLRLVMLDFDYSWSIRRLSLVSTLAWNRSNSLLRIMLFFYNFCWFKECIHRFMLINLCLESIFPSLWRIWIWSNHSVLVSSATLCVETLITLL